MHLHQVYYSSVPDFIIELTQTKEMQRLKGIGMDCGCDYTSFPQYAGIKPANRYDHSIGVALIVWNYTHDIKQTIAGLFHDIATPAFAHVIDFLNGDHIRQESTETATTKIIKNSAEIGRILKKYEINVEDVVDYHKYPIADNDLPQLSADRLEYTLNNLLRFADCDLDDISRYYNDIVVGCNEYGIEELMFKTADICQDFMVKCLPVFIMYSCDSNRFAMEAWAQLLRKAIALNVIELKDLDQSEKTIIKKLLKNEETNMEYNYLTNVSQIMVSKEQKVGEHWYKVDAKKRYVNPYVQNIGRAYDLFSKVRKEIDDYLNCSYDYWISAK